MAVTGADRQKYLTDLRRKATILLTETEGNYLLHAMKEYTTHKSVDKLMRSLLSCLTTPEKLDLLKDVRHLIPRAHVHLYDSLAPYSSMAHPVEFSVNYKNDPIRLRVQSDGMKYSNRQAKSDSGRPPDSPGNTRLKELHRDSERYDLLQRKLKLRGNDISRTNGTIIPLEAKNNSFRVVSFAKDGQTEQSLGFTIRGGKEYSEGVFVGSVLPNSPADSLGLKESDQIIEVNGISFDHIALSSAAKLLSSLNKLKLVVKTNVHPARSFETVELDPWNFSVSSSHSSASTHSSDHGGSRGAIDNVRVQASDSDAGSIKELNGDAAKDRKVRIVVDLSSTTDIGFNLRGGSEYGLGLYVSSVDQGSLAEKSGLQMGDQIISANGLSFEKIKHQDAVDFLRANKDIILVVRSVGKVPEARCFFSEFSWLTPDGVRIVDSNRNQQLSSSMPAGSLKDRRDVAVDSMDIEWNSTFSDFRSTKESVGIQTPDLIVPVDTLDIESRNRHVETVEVDGSPSALSENSKLHDESHANTSEVSLQTIPLPIEEDEDVDVCQAFAVSDAAIDHEDTGSIASKVTLQSVSRGSDYSKDETQTGKSPKLTFDPQVQDISRNESDSTSDISVHSTAVNGEWKKSSDVTSNPTKIDEKSNDVAGKKGPRSKSFLQKQGEKLKEKFSLRRKSKSVDRDLLHSHLFERQRSSNEVLFDIRAKAKAKMNEDDVNLLIKYIKLYLEKGDIELFSTQVIDIVDTPSKGDLLKDIREIVFPYDTSRFDVRIARREIEYLEELGDGAEPQIFDGAISHKPPRRTIVKAVQEKGGKFQLKSKEEAEQLEKEKELKSKKPSKIYFQTKSILERDKTIRKYDSFQNIPQPSSEYAAPLDQVGDDQEAPPALSAEELDAMYAKVDKTTKHNRKQSDSDKVYETFEPSDSNENDARDSKTDSSQLLVEGNASSAARPGSDDYETVSDEDDGYALPFVTRPSPSPSMESSAKTTASRKILVTIQKNHPTLGLSISGGRGSVAQPVVRIEKVFPGGAACNITGLSEGQQIASIDGESLDDASHSEAVDIIRRAYNDKTKPEMKMEVFID